MAGFWFNIIRWFGHRHFIRFGIRDRILRFLVNPDQITAIPFEVEFFGYRYRGVLNQYIDWVVFFYGAYERPNLKLLRDLLLAQNKTESVFVDVGANIGHHSLFMARYAAHIHSFEPFDFVREQLLEKISDNALSHVTVHPIGLGANSEELPFYEPNTGNTGLGTFVNDARHGTVLHGKSLRIEPADDYFPAHGINKVDLVKIDVEGFEPDVLLGMHKTIMRDRPIIMAEYSSQTRARLGSTEALADLVGDNYKIYTVSDDTNDYRLIPFNFDDVTGNIILVPAEFDATHISNGRVRR